MQNNRLSLARRIFLALAATLGLFLFSGCEVTIINLTPSALPANPSRIYTISTRVTPKISNLVAGSLITHIYIDGQSFEMKKSPLGVNIYEFDYQLPAGRDEIAYYFLTNYKVINNGIVTAREEYTGLIHAKIVGRYVLSLETNRGPVGARVSILGRGLTAEDVVYFDSTPARTVYESANAISFFVPAVQSGRNYKVQLGTASSAAGSVVGTFRVDATALTVSPESLALHTGQTQTLTFTLPNPAPTGGLLLDVTTDAPDSIIMPEIVVPAGSSSAIVNVTGGKAGSGSLFLKGFGTGEITVPVTVSAK